MNPQKYSIVIGMVLLIVLSACSGNDVKALPVIGISARIAEIGTDYCKLVWNVENESNIKATFLNGKIEQYEIINTNTNQKYTSERKSTDIVLEKGDEYSNIVHLTKLNKGSYQCEFWAESEEGTKGTMRISFEIE